MKVVVAVDLSPSSGKVVEGALSLAGSQDAEFVLIHAAEPDPDFVGYDAGPDVVRDQVADELRREHQALQALAEEMRRHGANTRALMIQGPTVEVLLNEAERLGAELLVVGSHGHGAVYDLLVGSYSADVLRHAKVPVLVVPTR